jgi:predicted enzyme related to lactoylglutathione lyase
VTGALRSAVPVFLVPDVAATMAWYKRTLGFAGNAVPEQPPHNFCILWKDSVEIFLQRLSGYERPDHYRERPGGVWDAYIRMNDVAAFYEAIRSQAGVTVLQPLHRQPYGQNEFEIKDPNGYVLVFAEPS